MAAFAVFEAYVTEFNELTSAARSLLDEYKESKKQGTDTAIESKIAQMDDCIKQMVIESKSHGSAERKMLQDRISEFSKKSTDFKSELRRAQEVAGRSALIGEKSAADRSRVMDINDKYDVVCVYLYVCGFCPSKIVWHPSFIAHSWFLWVNLLCYVCRLRNQNEKIKAMTRTVMETEGRSAAC